MGFFLTILQKFAGLVVGCNYPGSVAPLKGCVTDALNIHNMLISKFGYDEEAITVLLDEPPRSFARCAKPTKVLLAMAFFCSSCNY